MFEIELKAHVDDREAVIAALNSFAVYGGALQKEDAYWHAALECKEVTVRLRRESRFGGEDAGGFASRSKTDDEGNPRSSRVLFTYKRKEVRTVSDGASIEVNEEKECECSNADAIESFLADAGFTVCLRKSKRVLSWRFEDALFELCDVEGLGDFLEIEIMANERGTDEAAAAEEKLLLLLDKCAISRDRIEKRYYSELLRLARAEDGEEEAGAEKAERALKARGNTDV